MQATHQICQCCSNRLWFLFKYGFSATPRLSRFRNGLTVHRPYRNLKIRSSAIGIRYGSTYALADAPQGAIPSSLEQMETIVLQARQTFGETLPTGFLTSEEYKIYERLYGPPTHETRPEEVNLFQEVEASHYEELKEEENKENVLLRVDGEGKLEKVAYAQDDPDESIQETETADSLEEQELAQNQKLVMKVTSNVEFNARLALYRDIAAANLELEDATQSALDDDNTDVEDHIQENYKNYDDQNSENERVEMEEQEDPNNSNVMRSHPLTTAGRASTFPSTVQVPKNAVVDPISALLADASNKHLIEVSQKVFGGPYLPNSVATPVSKRHLQQQPIALEASQHFMGQMEANAYLAANIPGAYATILSILVEVRKRIGPEWFQRLLKRKDGPLILDAGGAGAGVFAWQEVLLAEWEILHPKDAPSENFIPFGRSTVITGSSPLRHRMSRLLQNTTFLPRVPDYNPSLDHPALEDSKASSRKRYDIIIAPHTLWTLKEDHIRKAQIENYWSLLNPTGGILIIIEKGVPRGFELVAGAREMLLKRHIASPHSPSVPNQIEEPFHELTRDKEKGMIIAPCTNHLKCPLYLTPGQSKGRKDFCHFSQRFIRPHFLQHILGAKDGNHEDIRYTYVAVQRGIDQREIHGIQQGPEAADAAFAGYEENDYESTDTPEPASTSATVSPTPRVPNVHTLSLPRTILPALKRRGHVILDVCTPAGKIERWTVPRSFSKQAYRDARKSCWGDLWALGAKTRIRRDARIGVKSRKAKGKSDYEVSGDQARTVEVEGKKGNYLYEKRTKKGRVVKRSQKREDLVL